MKFFVHMILRSAAVALLGACASGPIEVEFETLESDCRQGCHVVSFECDNAGKDPEADEDGCVDYCVSLKEDAQKQGDACAQSYETMMACVGATITSCEDWSAWVQRAEGGSCTAEAEDFDQKCDL